MGVNRYLFPIYLSVKEDKFLEDIGKLKISILKGNVILLGKIRRIISLHTALVSQLDAYLSPRTTKTSFRTKN